MALVKDAYGKERVPGSSSEKNTSGGSTPAPSGSSVNEQQRAEQTAMRNQQKPSSSSAGSNSQTASGNPFASAQSSVPATSNAWKRTSTSGSNINQEQRSEQFSARRMGTTLQAGQGGSGSYLGSQLQQQKQATDTTPAWRAKSTNEANTTTPKQPQFQPFLSDFIKARRKMEGKGPDMVQDRLSDEQKALMKLMERLPEDFPADTWDAMPTYKQRETIGKTDLNDQEQWMILNAGPSIKTLSMLLDLSQNQQEYGLSNAELLHVADQLLELGNVRTGAQNHDIFPGHHGLQKAGHTFIANKEDAIMEDIKLSASDRLAENAQFEDDPETWYAEDEDEDVSEDEQRIGGTKPSANVLFGKAPNPWYNIFKKSGAETEEPEAEEPETRGPDIRVIETIPRIEVVSKGVPVPIPYFSDIGSREKYATFEQKELFAKYENNAYAKKLFQEGQEQYEQALKDGKIRPGDPTAIQDYYKMFYNVLKATEEEVLIKSRQNGSKFYTAATKMDIILMSLDDSNGSAFVRKALEYYGEKYKLGGKNVGTDGGLDCSGLVYNAAVDLLGENDSENYNTKAKYQCSKTKSQSSWTWNAKSGEPLNQADMRPGDLVFVSQGSDKTDISTGKITHVMIYVGNGLVMDSSSIDGEVIIQNMNDYLGYAGPGYYFSHVNRIFD